MFRRAFGRGECGRLTALAVHSQSSDPAAPRKALRIALSGFGGPLWGSAPSAVSPPTERINPQDADPSLPNRLSIAFYTACGTSCAKHTPLALRPSPDTSTRHILRALRHSRRF